METTHFTQNTQQPNYDPAAVQPLRDELTAVGFKELLTPADVDKALNKNDNKTVFVVINSACGCAAAGARPAVLEALQNKIIPDELYTLFAGMEKEAVARYRQKYLAGIPPSSPSFALFRNGKVIAIFHRSDIEGCEASDISNKLLAAFNQLCSRKGPSISPEDFMKLKKIKHDCTPFHNYTNAI